MSREVNEMKKINLCSFIVCLFLISCNDYYPEMVEIKDVFNLNTHCGSFITWDSLSNATEYNIYSISSENINKILTTKQTNCLVDLVSTDFAVSAVIDDKETYLSSLKKSSNSWWTSVKCEKVDAGYSLSWKSLPIAEDYVLISHFKKHFMNSTYYYSVDEYKTTNLDEYHYKDVDPNPYAATYHYRKCESLNTTDNKIIYNGSHFDNYLYRYFICLYAKIGNTYYQISEKFTM